MPSWNLTHMDSVSCQAELVSAPVGTQASASERLPYQLQGS